VGNLSTLNCVLQKMAMQSFTLSTRFSKLVIFKSERMKLRSLLKLLIKKKSFTGNRRRKRKDN
jgi:hypothetical protein